MLHSTNRVTLELRHQRSGNLRYVRDNRIVVAIIRIAEVFCLGQDVGQRVRPVDLRADERGDGLEVVGLEDDISVRFVGERLEHDQGLLTVRLRVHRLLRQQDRVLLMRNTGLLKTCGVRSSPYRPVVDNTLLDGALQRQVTAVGHCQISDFFDRHQNDLGEKI